MTKKRIDLSARQQGIVGRRFAGIIAGILVIVVVMVLVASYGIIDLMEQRTHEAAEKLVSEVAAHIDTKMNEVSKATREASKTAKVELDNPEALEKLVYDFVNENDFVYGSTVAFEPDYFPELGRCYAPYSWKTSDGEVHSRQLGTETDYYEEEWYAETKELGDEYWCEPYFDEGGAKIMMCTFSIPLKDKSGKLAAVMTADVGLKDLEEYILSISPYPDSYIVLRSRNGNMLVNEELDTAVGNDTIIKGKTDIGWTVELMIPFKYLMRGDTGIFIVIGIIFLVAVFLVIFINWLLYKLQQRSSAEYLSVIDAISSGFDSIYLVNLLNNKTFIYREPSIYDELFNGSNSEEADFSHILSKMIEYNGYQSDKDLMHLETSLEAIRKHLTDKDRYEVRFRKITEGKVYWYEMHVFVMERDADGNAISAVVTFSNVNESVLKEKKAQAALEDALAMVETSSRAKTDFLFNMSHDIRTPMNAIKGFTAMARKNADNSEKVSEYLDKIDISGGQLLSLINQVLEMARIESGKIVLDEKPVNVREEFNSMVTVLAEQASVSGLAFEYSLKNLKHNNVLADEARMSSITLNIAGNAMKYTPEGGRIDYELREIPRRKPGYATFVFTVRDTGIGMSEEYLKELYEPFSRENNTTVSKIQGTGLGLSIVKNLIDLMGGTIDVKSKLGEGTRFDVTVDFKIDNNALQTEELNEEIETISFDGCRVLLVEDNEMNREIARDILEEQNFIVEDAEDGDVAVSKIQEIVDRGELDYYDFILMDIQMPTMNGYEATTKIREILEPLDKHIPIIAMTANAFEEDKQNAFEAGMDDHLAKPIDIPQMIRVLAKHYKCVIK